MQLKQSMKKIKKLIAADPCTICYCTIVSIYSALYVNRGGKRKRKVTPSGFCIIITHHHLRKKAIHPVCTSSNNCNNPNFCFYKVTACSPPIGGLMYLGITFWRQKIVVFIGSWHLNEPMIWPAGGAPS